MISEGSRHIPDEIKAERPDIPWRDVATIGNVFRHQYHAVAPRIVWDTVNLDLPALEVALRAIAAEQPRGDEPAINGDGGDQGPP